jgi:hypothetical protein
MNYASPGGEGVEEDLGRLEGANNSVAGRA